MSTRSPLKVSAKTLLVGLLSLGVIACSSGGGGGGGSSFNPAPPAPPPPPPPPPPSAQPPAQVSDPATFETQEYLNTEGLPFINASYAYSTGATGEGITIAVIDTGTDPDHPDLQGQILTTSFDVNAGEREAGDIDPEGHGTLVSGIIAANKDNSAIHGVAFESRILDIRADEPGTCLDASSDDGCRFNDTDLVLAIEAAVDQGAQIINMSLGGDIDGSQVLENAIRSAAAQGVLFVISAGNEARPAGPDPDDPDVTLPAEGLSPNEPAYIAGEAASLGLVVAVGSVDLNGQLSDFSNRAGEASQDFYLLAPGEDVITTGPDGDDPADGIGDYYRVGGTSFAAPYVAGALALILESFSNIDAETALQILLDTADDYIDPDPDPVTGEIAGEGTDPVAGVGIINLEAAFTPQGATSMTFGSQMVDLTSALSAPSGAFGDWAAASGAFNGLIFQDKYGRAFEVGDTRLLGATTVMASLEERANWTMGQSRAVKAGNLSLSWNQPRLAPDPSIPYEREPETLYTARFAFDGGLVEFGRGGQLSSIAPRASLTQEPGSPNALGGNGNWARITRDLGRLSFDAFSSNNQYQDITGVGLSRYGDGWVTRAAMSSIKSDETALGSSIQSRFGGEDRMEMMAYTLEAAVLPFRKARTFFSGMTLSAGMEAAEVTLLDSAAENVWTSRWSFGATQPVKGGSVSFIIAQPRRAEAGTISFQGPVAITEEGDILYDTVNAALLPSGRQVDFETRWRFSLTERLYGSAVAAIATSPHHVAGAETEEAIWLSLGSDL